VSYDPRFGGSSGDPGIWIKWDRRRLAFLRVRVVAPAEAGVAHGVARALSLGVETVRSFGGRIEELDRTGFVASFGLEPTENVSVRAALVAQEIQRTSSRMGMALPLGVTAAIHVAEVSIGQAGDVTVIDRTDRTDAWRILDAASPQAAFNDVLASRAAVPFLEERFLLEPIASAQEVAGSYLRVRGLGP